MQLESLGNLLIAKDIIRNSSNDFNTISDTIRNLSNEYKAAARSTTNLGTAFKGLGEQIKTAITAHPYIAVAAAILANYKKFAYRKQPYIQSIRLFCVCKQCTYYFKRKDMIPMT